MLNLLSRIRSLFVLFGFDPAKLVESVIGLPWFFKQHYAFTSANNRGPSQFAMAKLYPCLHDRKAESGLASGHYFHGDLLVARRVFEMQPSRHADVGSRIDGFVAHVAAYRQLDVFDIRPLDSFVKNINFRMLDLTKPLGEELAGRYDSVSCLHALEHFGLGRYGDDLDWEGHLKGFAAISKLVRPGGRFYLSVPMGRQRIEFNAHRVFSLSYLKKMCEAEYLIDRFSYVDDDGRLFENAPIDADVAQHNFDCHYGLAIFELIKV